jgi:hypothetical protein
MNTYILGLVFFVVLKTTTAQLQALSTLPVSQQEGHVKKAINDIQKKVTAVERQVKSLSSEFQSHLDTMNNRMNALEATYVAHNSIPSVYDWN